MFILKSIRAHFLFCLDVGLRWLFLFPSFPPPEFSLVRPAFPAFPSASNYFIWTSGCLKCRLLVAWFVGGALKQSKRAFSATHAKTEARIFPSAGMLQIAVLSAEL